MIVKFISDVVVGHIHEDIHSRYGVKQDKQWLDCVLRVEDCEPAHTLDAADGIPR